MPNDDYIKRDDVKTAVYAWYVDAMRHGEKKYLDEVIAKIPAADVAKVRRGRWEYDSYGVPCCTACGEPALQRLKLQLKIKSFEASFVKSNHCPWCGAKMDKEEDHENRT